MPAQLKLREKLQIVSDTYQMLGWWHTLKQVIIYLLQQGPKDTFDDKFGVSTAEIVATSEAGIEDVTGRSFAIKYVATPEPVMQHVLHNATRGLQLDQVSFIDLGCGKGRTLIMAAHHPFKEVIGVELSPRHCQIAENNMESFLATNHTSCTAIQVVCSNATDFKFPDNDLLIYMYRPFLSAVVSQLAENLCHFQSETGHRVLLAYSCPMEEDILAMHPGYIKLRKYQTISIEHSWTLWECRPD